MPILAAKGTASVILFNQENRHNFCLNPLHFDDLNIGTHVRLVATILMKLSTTCEIEMPEPATVNSITLDTYRNYLYKVQPRH